MDYTTETERQKKYYIGLENAGNIAEIEAMHSLLVKDIEEFAEEQLYVKTLRLWLYSVLPLYHKLAYVVNNRLIHENLTDILTDDTTNVHTPQEIYRSLLQLAPYTADEVIRTIGCNASTMAAIAKAFNDEDIDRFVYLLDSKHCDLRGISRICDQIWVEPLFSGDCDDETLALQIDTACSIVCENADAPLSTDAMQTSRAFDHTLNSGEDFDQYLQQLWKYNYDFYEWLSSYYDDLRPRLTAREQRQIEPYIAPIEKPAASFCLNDDFYTHRISSRHHDEYFGLSPMVLNAGPAPLQQLIDYLAEQGYIENTPTTKRLFAYRFSGCQRPDELNTIEWNGKNNRPYELIFLIKYLTRRASYIKMRRFFNGPEWVKSQDSSYAVGADTHLRATFDQLFPNLVAKA